MLMRASLAPSWRHAPQAGFWLAVLFTLSANEASAAAIGSLATSVGMLAALTALVAFKSWPAHLPAAALTTGGGVLVVAAAAAWLWRMRSPHKRLAALGLVRAGTRGVGAGKGHGSGFITGASAGTASALAAAAHEAIVRRPVIVMPDGFQQDSLLAEMRLKFVQLQAAWDQGDKHALGSLTTPEMFDELCFDLSGCGSEVQSNRTDVVTLDAELLCFEELASAFLVTVEFSGLIRESADRGAAPFRELWMLARSKPDGSPWKLARHQALL